MPEDDLIKRATGLGMDHADLDQAKRLHHRLRSGHEVAVVLGVPELPPELRRDLLDAYDWGWSSWA